MNQASAAALLYLLSAVLFILALKGLSSPATSRAGNRNGMIGMAIAVATTLWIAGVTDPLTWALIVGGFVIGGTIGAVVAKRISMTAMPQLVAAFHSLVGLAAVLTAAAALYSPQAFGIGVEGAIRTQSLVEMSLGAAIGAITFAGSLIAFAIITEQVFAFSGMGALFQRGITLPDPNPVMGYFVVIAVMVIVFNFIADMTYSALDPRVRTRG